VTPGFNLASTICKSRSARDEGRRKHERSPKLRFEEVKAGSRGHDANHSVQLSVETYARSDDRAIAAEPRCPEPMAEDDDVIVARLIVIGSEGPADPGVQAEDVEVGRRHERSFDVHWLLSGPNRDAAPRRGGDALEDVTLRDPIEVIQAGRRSRTQKPRPRLAQLHETVRVRVWKRLEEYRANDAEDRGVGADTNGDRQDGDGGRERSFRISRSAYRRSSRTTSP
jgi:hypothetical protein